MKRSTWRMTGLLWAGMLPAMGVAGAATMETSGVRVKVDEASGRYEISAKEVGWTLSGSLNTPLTPLASLRVSNSMGGLMGDSEEMAFAFQDGDKKAMRGSIRVYAHTPVVLFTETYVEAAARPSTMFPAFTSLPANLHAFSHGNSVFAPPSYALGEHNMPWVFFDDAANTWILSPAAHFLAARLSGDGKTAAGSGLNAAITAIPKGFEQRTLLAAGKGINRTWETWGRALTDLQGRKRPANDADLGLKYFGYWTDNGANYYYNYDRNLGYAGTLLALADHYKEAKIPLGYMQLDSWWYYKSLDDPKGVRGGPKAPSLPAGEWNRYGGLLDYTAHKDLFPEGLAAFQKKLGLPLMTHNRWVDRASPYHEKYKITGVAAVDPKWWDDVMTYLKSSGVVTYEQDWLNEIYNNSPELGNTVDQGDAFMDNMARAAREQGMTLQYCMGLPCHYLEGSTYDNLTTTRVSGDNFVRTRWRSFLFTSRLASALGIWPWSDVFRSTDRNSMLLANLSAGMVGIGDAIGQENRDNILLAVRPDGVIVKPDAALAPTDDTYIGQAGGQTDVLIGSTYTDQTAGRTGYIFAWSQRQTVGAAVRFSPGKMGVKGVSYVYDSAAEKAVQVADGGEFSGQLGPAGVSYYIAAPLGKSGIAFLGDQGKFVSLGRQRIASVKDEAGRLTADVTLCAGDETVILHGYVAAGGVPRITAAGATVGETKFDAASGHFSVALKPGTAVKGETRVSVVMETR